MFLFLSSIQYAVKVKNKQTKHKQVSDYKITKVHREKETMWYFNGKYNVGMDCVCLLRKEHTEEVICEQRSVGR